MCMNSPLAILSVTYKIFNLCGVYVGRGESSVKVRRDAPNSVGNQLVKMIQVFGKRSRGSNMGRTVRSSLYTRHFHDISPWFSSIGFFSLQVWINNAIQWFMVLLSLLFAQFIEPRLIELSFQHQLRDIKIFLNFENSYVMCVANNALQTCKPV